MADQYDDDQTDDSTDDSALVRQLRKQIKDQSKELNELRPYRDERVLQQAGFDPDSKQGKALLRLHDGDLTADALKQTADEYGFTPAEPVDAETEQVDAETQQRVETTQRIDSLRDNAEPVGTAPKASYAEWQQMQQSNPAEAQKALAEGRVVLPQHIAATLEANRAERAQTLGA